MSLHSSYTQVAGKVTPIRSSICSHLSQLRNMLPSCLCSKQRLMGTKENPLSSFGTDIHLKKGGKMCFSLCAVLSQNFAANTLTLPKKPFIETKHYAMLLVFL